jgi:C-terminal processing protease CtpA/Prc
VHVGHFRKRDKEDQRSTTELKDQKIKIREKKKEKKKKEEKEEVGYAGLLRFFVSHL